MFFCETVFHNENGLLENLQVCFLLSSLILYMWSAIYSTKKVKLIFLMLATLCYAFVLREIDVEKLDVPEFFKIIGSGLGRNITVSTLFLLILVFVSKNGFLKFLKSVIEFNSNFPNRFLVFSCCFLILAGYFEVTKNIKHNVFFEEVLELFAYELIFLSSLINSFHIGRKRFS